MPRGCHIIGKMRSFNPTLLCALFLLLSLSGAAAQPAKPAAPPAAPSAESVVQIYLEALKAGDFQKSAELMHPEALEKFRSLLIPLAEASAGEEGEDNLLSLFKGVSDVAALKKLSPAAFFTAFFNGLTEMSPGLKDALASGNMTVIGSVPEGDTLHVVCRTSVKVEELSIAKMEVMSLKRHEGNWRVLLSGEMEGLAQALSKSVAGRT
jgi:hypothetical protein